LEKKKKIRDSYVWIFCAGLLLSISESRAKAQDWRDFVNALPLFTPSIPPPYPESFRWDDAEGDGLEDLDDNYVSPIKNQNDCGICVIFATIAALETEYMIRFNITRSTPDLIPDLSEWILSACTVGIDGDACNPEQYIFNFLNFIQSSGTIEEIFLPFIPSSFLECKDLCNWREPPIDWYRIQRFERVEVIKEPGIEPEDLKAAILQGPVITVSKGFNGVVNLVEGPGGIKSCSWPVLPGDTMPPKDHGLLIIGYEHYEGKFILIVKNSWGYDDPICGGGICKIQFLPCYHGEYLQKPECRPSCDIGLENARIADFEVGPLNLLKDSDRDLIHDEICDNCPEVPNISQANCDELYDSEQPPGHTGGDACDPDPCIYIQSIGESSEPPLIDSIARDIGRMRDITYTPVGYNAITGERTTESDVLLARCQCTSYWADGWSIDKETDCDRGDWRGNCNREGRFIGNKDRGVG